MPRAPPRSAPPPASPIPSGPRSRSTPGESAGGKSASRRSSETLSVYDTMRRHPSLRRDIRLATRAVIALTVLVLLADAIVSVWTGLYLNLGTGVWLALARDVRDGLFYRPIWNGVEYGGTRYFPMLFVPIGVLMRAGVPAVTAGLIVSIAGLAALAAAVVWLLGEWSVPRLLALLGGAAIVAPYFVHQTAFA